MTDDDALIHSPELAAAMNIIREQAERIAALTVERDIAKAALAELLRAKEPTKEQWELYG